MNIREAEVAVLQITILPIIHLPLQTHQEITAGIRQMVHGITENLTVLMLQTGI